MVFQEEDVNNQDSILHISEKNLWRLTQFSKLSQSDAFRRSRTRTTRCSLFSSRLRWSAMRRSSTGCRRSDAARPKAQEVVEEDGQVEHLRGCVCEQEQQGGFCARKGEIYCFEYYLFEQFLTKLLMLFKLCISTIKIKYHLVNNMQVK